MMVKYQRVHLVLLSAIVACSGESTTEPPTPVTLEVAGVLTQGAVPLGAATATVSAEPCPAVGSCSWSATTAADGTYRVTGTIDSSACGDLTLTFTKASRNLASADLALNGCGPHEIGHDFAPAAVIGTIEWPFQSFQRTDVPARVEVGIYYNGFYNPSPCDNAHTTLPASFAEWGSTYQRGFDADDPGFVGFAACLVDGTDQVLALNQEGVSAWAIEESLALDSGAPDLVGHSVLYMELIVDEASLVGSPGSYTVGLVLRWLVYGS